MKIEFNFHTHHILDKNDKDRCIILISDPYALLINCLFCFVYISVCLYYIIEGT